jgi:hypothetical protein
MAAKSLGAALCLLLLAVPQAAHGQQLTVGSGSTLRVSANLSITSSSVSCLLSDGLTNVTSTCLLLSSLILPDHPVGPWCSGGFWSATADGTAKQVQLGGIAVNCNCQRNACTSTCGDVCLECPLQASQTPYLIPLVPQPGAATLSAMGDNNHGQGLALNGVVLAPADPFTFLTSANNIAPLDAYGGHATLQFVYHCACPHPPGLPAAHSLTSPHLPPCALSPQTTAFPPHSSTALRDGTPCTRPGQLRLPTASTPHSLAGCWTACPSLAPFQMGAPFQPT